MNPPGVTLLGPFNTACYQTALATYPFQVRVMPSVQGRTRTGTLRFLSEPHGLRLSAVSPRLTLFSGLAVHPFTMKQQPGVVVSFVGLGALALCPDIFDAFLSGYAQLNPTFYEAAFVNPRVNRVFINRCLYEYPLLSPC